MYKNIAISLTLLVVSVLLAANFWGYSYADNKMLQYSYLGICAIASSVIVLFLLATAKRSSIRIPFTYLDLAVILLTSWVCLNFVITSSMATPQLFIFLLLVVCYFNLKFLFSIAPESKKYVLFLIFAIALIEVCIGLNQMFTGSSNHGLYKITGTFFNPGPYGGYVASIGALAIGVLMFFKQEKRIIYIVSATTLAATVLVLPASMSRTAWVAILFALGVAACFHPKTILYIKRHRSVILLGVCVLVSMAVGAYMLKADSANGRFLMWQVGIDAILAEPLNGVGLGHFVESYSPAQREFLKANPSWVDAAGAPGYVFNEYIKVGMEQGLIGLVLFMSAITIALFSLFKQDNYHKSIAISFIALLVFAIGSYPFSLLPFSVLMIIYLAYASSNGKELINIGKITSITTSLILLSISTYSYLQVDSKSHGEWTKSSALYSMKYYEEVASDYSEFEGELNYDYGFLFEYGHSLVKIGEYEKGISVLEKAQRMCTDPMINNIIGNGYMEMKNYDKAAENYLLAYEMIPSRVYPLYLLVQLYDKSGNRERCQYYGQKLLNQQDKISSPASKDIRTEVKKILQKLHEN